MLNIDLNDAIKSVQNYFIMAGLLINLTQP
jgi:hypothetical protein